MWRATLKNLYSRKLRLALTTLAVVLGVGFISGTLVLGDTMRAAFADAFGELTGEVDVQVRGETEFDGTTSSDEHAPVPATVVGRIATVKGVAAVEPQIEGYAQLLDRNGKPIGGDGPPTIGGNVPRNEDLAGVELREGRYPRAPDEVAIDAGTVRNQGLAVGDTTGVVVPNGPARRVKIVGVVGFGELDNLGGATLVMFDRETALDLFSPKEKAWSTVAVRAESGVSRHVLADRVAAAAGPGFEVLTGEEALNADLADVSDSLSFLTALLLLFGAVSLFVGAFLISNTSSIIVAQRTHELGLLRTLGASRNQVLVSIMAEATITGLLGSVAGLVLGLGVASGLEILLSTIGIDLPDAPLVFAPHTAATGIRRVPVAGVIEGSGLSADFVLDDATFEQNFEGVSPMQVNVRLAQDAAVDELRARIEHALAPFPTAEVRDAEEAKEKAAANVDELLGLLLALLLLSVVVALLGIANTLSLSIFERFREIGLLRAVGATRAQVRSTVRWEALLVTLTGGILGVGIGMLLGWGVVQALEDQGITEFAVPTFRLAATVLLAGAGGLLAAALPARRASRIEILRATTIE